MQNTNANAGKIVPQKLQHKKRILTIEKRDFKPVVDEPQLLYIEVVALSDGSLNYEGRILGYLDEFDRLYKKI